MTLPTWLVAALGFVPLAALATHWWGIWRQRRRLVVTATWLPKGSQPLRHLPSILVTVTGVNAPSSIASVVVKRPRKITWRVFVNWRALLRRDRLPMATLDMSEAQVTPLKPPPGQMLKVEPGDTLKFQYFLHGGLAMAWAEGPLVVEIKDSLRNAPMRVRVARQ